MDWTWLDEITSDPLLLKAAAFVVLVVAIPILVGVLARISLREIAPDSLFVQRARPEETLIWLGGAVALLGGAVIRIGYQSNPVGMFLNSPYGWAYAGGGLLCALFLLSYSCEALRNRRRKRRQRR